MRMRFSVLLLLLSISVQASAREHECVADSVVLRNKFRPHQISELAAIKELVALEETDRLTVAGTNRARARNRRDVCSEIKDPCRELHRNARKKGFSHIRRIGHSTCSPNYILNLEGLRRNKNKKAKKPRFPMNDSLYRHQERAWNLIDAPRAWTLTKGSSSVIVTVIDTGVDYRHPDLSANILKALGRDFTSDVTGLDPMDGNGHGTHVAGTIAAVGNNKMGVTGIAPNVKVIPLKFLNANGSGTLSGAVRAIDYMVELKKSGVNISVSNNSWGGGGFSTPLYNAIQSAVSAGIVFVVAAGNEANDNDSYPAYPASYQLPNLVSVAAVDPRDGWLAYFSNYGQSSVQIAAPGVSIASTYPSGQYVKLSGTSMAAPHVSGALALLKSYQSWMDSTALVNRMLTTSQYSDELAGAVANARLLNVRNMLRNRTADATRSRKRRRS